MTPANAVSTTNTSTPVTPDATSAAPNGANSQPAAGGYTQAHEADAASAQFCATFAAGRPYVGPAATHAAWS